MAGDNTYELPPNLRGMMPRYLGISIMLLIFLVVIVPVTLLLFPSLARGSAIIVLVLLLCASPFVLFGLLLLVAWLEISYNRRLKAWIEETVRCPDCGSKVKTTRWPSALAVLLLKNPSSKYNPCEVQCTGCRKTSLFYIGHSTVEPLDSSNVIPAVLGPTGSFVLSRLGIKGIYTKEDAQKAVAIYLIIIVILVFIFFGIVYLFIFPHK